ncbi:hypothetical protein EBME_0464 [bacterium endosymbiont of Mortierella elongata FMR23-6]|nr:hypothetical protein EBME_0464 [bacterium endosymbiont of Mortierella elongata FMR23-6]
MKVTGMWKRSGEQKLRADKQETERKRSHTETDPNIVR